MLDFFIQHQKFIFLQSLSASRVQEAARKPPPPLVSAPPIAIRPFPPAGTYFYSHLLRKNLSAEVDAPDSTVLGLGRISAPHIAAALPKEKVHGRIQCCGAVPFWPGSGSS